MHTDCIRRNDWPNIKLVNLFKLVGTDLKLVSCLVIRDLIGGFYLFQYLSGIVLHHGTPPPPPRCHITFMSNPHL